ncbi:cystathionine beta-lyase [Xylogone sp. PMI_703]|nr:cystathionine beta-lyase [Xylogone sp. PMI_703]
MGELGPIASEEERSKIGLTNSHTLPLGASQPPNEPHAISVSLPTWESVAAAVAGAEWIDNKLQTSYPRFGAHDYVIHLHDAIMARFEHPTNMACRAFPSRDAAKRLVSWLKKADPELSSSTARFFFPSALNISTSKWAGFSVVLYHKSLENKASVFWEWFGDGISSRQAAFCLSQFHLLDSESEDPKFQTFAQNPNSLIPAIHSEWIDSATKEKLKIRSQLARFSESAKPNMKQVKTSDVFLYPTGMAAISAVSRTLAQTSSESVAVVYGWPYSGTPHCVENCGFQRFIMYGHGSPKELDQLETLLATGVKITVLFCEIPSNPQLQSPDLHHIRDLARQFNFMVVCDDTLGTSVNVDILPYIDVTVTSLTKIFSGAGNVMGGSLIVNPNSRHYARLLSLLSRDFEDLYFPLDAKAIAQNSSDFIDRIHKCNDTALQTAKLLASHPAIESVNYPTMVPTAHLFERYRRPSGGYGYMLSIVFREPESAILFYDNLDVWKGPSVGLNSSIAVPYSALAHAKEQDWAASHGVPPHIVRLSIGLEDYSDLESRIKQALRRVEEREAGTL